MIYLIQADVLDYLSVTPPVQTIFADPPDNLGLKYSEYNDNKSVAEYLTHLADLLRLGTAKSNVFWMSYNSKWTFEVGKLVVELLRWNSDLEAKACVQTYTFGQHNQNDLGGGHRPLLRIMKKDTQLYPDAIREKSWRQEYGDKRADSRGRVPSDVFDFPRVTGNSSQRRPYHPTQLHEDLVKRCIRLTSQQDDVILDLYAGTGTTLRVCKNLGMSVVSVEMDTIYCEKIVEEHELTENTNPFPWKRTWCGA